jgi:hypothetical protein
MDEFLFGWKPTLNMGKAPRSVEACSEGPWKGANFCATVAAQMEHSSTEICLGIFLLRL